MYNSKYLKLEVHKEGNWQVVIINDVCFNEQLALTLSNSVGNKLFSCKIKDGRLYLEFQNDNRLKDQLLLELPQYTELRKV
jgi:hypothetical protein